MPEAIALSDIKAKSIFDLLYERTHGWAMYRFPNGKSVHFMAGEYIQHPLQEDDKHGFAIAPFHSGKKGLSFIRNDYNGFSGFPVEERYLDGLPRYAEAKNPRSESTKEAYTSLVGKVLDEIQKDTFQKAVPARSKQVELKPDFSPSLLFKNLMDAYPNAFVYWFSTAGTGSWMGCSPETLVKAKGTKISTLSLAGTRKTGYAPSDGFTSKETDEQALVTQYIKERFNGFCTETTIDGPHELNTGNLTHLSTNFNGILKPEYEGSYLQIAQVLHPTPAVCGLPQKPAIDFLFHNEGFDRSLYAGFVGPLFTQEAWLFVNLRCMRFSDKSATLYAGAGVVQGSVPEKEWEETEEKMNTLLRFL